MRFEEFLLSERHVKFDSFAQQTHKIPDARLAKRQRSVELPFFPDSLSRAPTPLCVHTKVTLASGCLPGNCLPKDQRQLYRAASELQSHMSARGSRFFTKHQKLSPLNLPRQPLVSSWTALEKKFTMFFRKIFQN